MADAESSRATLRWERAETSRLAWAFAISVALHLFCFGTFEAGRKFGWWQNFHWPAWFQAPKILAELLHKKSAEKETPKELPLLYVDVSPEQEATEAPKDATHYAARNSKAANPEAQIDTSVPKISGKRPELVKTEDVPKFVPLQPARSAPQPQPTAQEEQKARKTEAPGDLAFAKPDPVPRKDNGEAEKPRPRTIKEAMALQPAAPAPGEKMKLDGGTSRHARISSVDAKLTSYGAYDSALVDAISQRWFTLLDERSYASDAEGKVVLQFRLHSDGRVTDMSVAENTAGEVLGLICQKAVLDQSPYGAWSNDMRRMLGDERNIQFTFYYN